MNWFRSAAVALCACLLPWAAQCGDAYPNRPIRLVVGFAIGGPTDVIARVLANEMSTTLGQIVYVDNRVGASSMIAIREVKNAAPDGYTLLFSAPGLNVNPILLGAQAGFDPQKDFVPIGNAATLPMVVVTSPSSPLRSMADLIAKARAKPGSVSFASSGIGSPPHLAGELLGQQAGVKMLHVPYKGNGPALLDVMAGREDFMFYPVIGIADKFAAGRLKVLAVGTAKSLAQFPGVPTMAESGFPGFEETAPWVGMLAPAHTPGAIVRRLNAAMVAALAKPDVKAQLHKLGAQIVGDSPPEFAAYLRRDYDRWQGVARAAKVQLQME
ncbi:MAG: tripartite tricarboxylate transporter substrate binding protein [Burkholderiales bacterium]|nr:tripartite tricarboxylate transporter substrate binding protein [Burkholderiales bacterium]